MVDPSKVDIIPLHPQTPGCHKKYVHKQRLTPVFFASMDQGDSVSHPWAKHANFGPAAPTKWAGEEQVLNCFLRWVLTKHAGINVVSHTIVSMFQHVSCVQAINQQQPSEHFEFDWAFRFPKPEKGFVRDNLSETVVIEFIGGEFPTKDAFPSVIAIPF